MPFAETLDFLARKHLAPMQPLFLSIQCNIIVIALYSHDTSHLYKSYIQMQTKNLWNENYENKISLFLPLKNNVSDKSSRITIYIRLFEKGKIHFLRNLVSLIVREEKLSNFPPKGKFMLINPTIYITLWIIRILMNNLVEVLWIKTSYGTVFLRLLQN